jgi:hypothetical protein
MLGVMTGQAFMGQASHGPDCGRVTFGNLVLDDDMEYRVGVEVGQLDSVCQVMAFREVNPFPFV